MTSCRCCAGPLKPRRAGRAHQLCENCYLRWQRAGFPEEVPPPLRPWGRVYPARLEDYADLRSWGVGLRDAAVRLGVSVRTSERYEKQRKAAGRPVTEGGRQQQGEAAA